MDIDLEIPVTADVLEITLTQEDRLLSEDDQLPKLATKESQEATKPVSHKRPAEKSLSEELVDSTEKVEKISIPAEENGGPEKPTVAPLSKAQLKRMRKKQRKSVVVPVDDAKAAVDRLKAETDPKPVVEGEEEAENSSTQQKSSNESREGGKMPTAEDGTKQPAKERLLTLPQEKASTSYREATMGTLKLAIVKVEEPERKFTTLEQDALLRTITLEVLNAVQRGECPRMEGIIREGGQFIVRCSDLQCHDWIKALVGEEFRPWEGAKLIAVSPSQLSPLNRCRIWIPNKYLSREDAIQCLAGLNQGLFTHRWTFGREEVSTIAVNGMSFTVFVDADSLKEIQKRKGELYYATGKARVVSYPGMLAGAKAKQKKMGNGKGVKPRETGRKSS